MAVEEVSSKYPVIQEHLLFESLALKLEELQDWHWLSLGPEQVKQVFQH